MSEYVPAKVGRFDVIDHNGRDLPGGWSWVGTIVLCDDDPPTGEDGPLYAALHYDGPGGQVRYGGTTARADTEGVLAVAPEWSPEQPEAHEPVSPGLRALYALRRHLDEPSGAALARRLGVTRGYLHRVLRGHTGLTLDRVQEWCAVEGLRLVVEPSGAARVERVHR